MSIISQINRIKLAKLELKNLILNNGGSISDNALLNSYSSVIEELLESKEPEDTLNILFGVVNTSGEFQQLDCNESPPVPTGDPVAGNFYSFITNLRSDGGGSSTSTGDIMFGVVDVYGNFQPLNYNVHPPVELDYTVPGEYYSFIVR